MAQIILSIEGIKQDLKQGLTRLSSDPNHDPKIGSIEEKYALSKTQVQAVFKDPRLKGLKTVKPKTKDDITFQEDLNDALPEGTLNVSGVSEESDITEYISNESNATIREESLEEDLTVSTVEEVLAENNTSDTDVADLF